ncbi:MAG TPA: hypothetical protein VFX24_10990 [Ktedonobacterales bacterium]|nr:hypothetical protein [Ktedonobacterales bacterium]
MNLLDRYVRNVRTYLPKSLPETQRDDIVNELSENIQARMDDREAELGRSLTEDEQEAILHEYGHPMIAAGRYQTNQEARVVFGRQLIGTTLFPIYLRVLWIVMAISLAIYAVVLVGLAISGNPLSVGDVITTVIMQVAIQVAVITGIFAVADNYLPMMEWSAKGLPVAVPQTPAPARQGARIPRMESLGEIIGIVVLVGWFWFAFDRPFLLFGPALGGYQLGPVWQQVAIPTLLVLAVSVAQAVVNLFRPEWVRMKRVVRVLTDIAALGIVAYLLQAGAGQWVVAASGSSVSASALSGVNEVAHYGLLATAVGVLIVIGMDAWRLIRGERQQRRQDRRQPQPA